MNNGGTKDSGGSAHSSSEEQKNACHWSSEIVPPPDMLREYDKLIENGANRFMGIAEEEQKKRFQHEFYIILASIFVPLVSIGAALVAGHMEQPWLGAALASFGAGGGIILRTLLGRN